VDSDTFDLGKDEVGMNWNCERDNGEDKLAISQSWGKEPNITRTLGTQAPKRLVDCSAEVYSYGKDRLAMSSGFCPTYWALDIRLAPSNKDEATVDLKVADLELNGYRCTRAKVGKRA
jgi:hypothetical protein